MNKQTRAEIMDRFKQEVKEGRFFLVSGQVRGLLPRAVRQAERIC